MENGTDETAAFEPVESAQPEAQVTRGKQLLPCTLTTAERLASAERMALLIEQREGLVADLRELAAGMRDRVKRVEGEIAQVAMRIRTGSEDRIVEIMTVTDLAGGQVRTYRTDTGELIATRDLTDLERQQAFNFRDPEPEPAPEAEPAGEAEAPA